MDQVEALRGEVQAWREETERARGVFEDAWAASQTQTDMRIRQFRLRTLLATAICVILTGAGALLAWNVVEVRRQNAHLEQLVADSNARWCPVLTVITRVDPDGPQPTPHGVVVGQQLRGLMAAFGCPAPVPRPAK